MPIQVVCEHCDASFRVDDAYAGKRGRCPKCRQAIDVPDDDPGLVPVDDDPGLASSLSRRFKVNGAASTSEGEEGNRDESETYDLGYASKYQAAKVSSSRRSVQGSEADGSSTSPSSIWDKSRQAAAAAPAKLTPAQILSSLGDRIEPVRPSWLYRFWILIVAAGMVVLPLVYLGIVVVCCLLLAWYVTLLPAILPKIRNGKAAMFVVLGPLGIGGLLILFMIKPFFAKPIRPMRRKALDPSHEPLLFAFVDGICQTVGAPTPIAIYVDCNVNASAGPEYGFGSLLRRRLVLTIGLPLVAGLETRNFAGVLAHEFGHFSQSAGMKVSYLINSINRWFARVVYERDTWDQQLAEWTQSGFGIATFIGLIAMLAIWLTRRILWCLMMAGHAISMTMSRQMEFDADRYEYRLVGSKAFGKTCKQLHLLNAAMSGAHADLSNSWREGRLADSLPSLVMANIPQIPPTFHESLAKMIEEKKTGVFDSHPSDRDRIAAAWAAEQEGIFRLKGPATQLFRDFDRVAQKATLDYYKSVFGDPLPNVTLEPVSEIVAKTEATHHGNKALDHFFLGEFSVFRPLELPRELPSPPADLGTSGKALKTARNVMAAQAEQYRKTGEELSKVINRLMLAETAVALRREGFSIKASEFELTSGKLEGAEEAVRRNKTEIENLTDRLVRFEAAATNRLREALCLLEYERMAEKIEDWQAWRREARELYTPTVIFTRDAVPAIERVARARFILIGVIEKYHGHEKDEKIHRAIKATARTLRERLIDARRPLASIRYPFNHARGDVSLADLAIERVPEEDAIGDLVSAADAILDQMGGVYFRMLGRLVLAAEEVEQGIGLPELRRPDPPDASVSE